MVVYDHSVLNLGTEWSYRTIRIFSLFPHPLQSGWRVAVRGIAQRDFCTRGVHKTTPWNLQPCSTQAVNGSVTRDPMGIFIIPRLRSYLICVPFLRFCGLFLSFFEFLFFHLLLLDLMVMLPIFACINGFLDCVQAPPQ